jgi:16S rRNA C1402 N4-methylase RsmH
MRPPLTPFQTLENFSLRLPTEADQNAVPDWIAGFESEWKMKIITGKPIEPSEEEVEANPLSRSCKLRVLEKVEL